MKRERVASVLERVLEGYNGVHDEASIAQARREFRALKSTFRRAEEMAALTEAALQCGEQVCASEISLWHEVQKVRRLSRSPGSPAGRSRR